MDFDQVYRENAPFLRGIGYRICGDVWVAEDLLQETFLRALEQLASEAPSREELLAISTKLAVALVKSRKALNDSGVWLPTPVQTDLGGIGDRRRANSEEPYESPAEASLRFDFLCALEALAPEARAMFVLADFAGLNASTIGKICTRPASAVELSLVETRLLLQGVGLYRETLEGALAKKSLVEEIGASIGSGAIKFPPSAVAPVIEVSFDHGGTCNAPANQSCRPASAATMLHSFLTRGETSLEIQVAEVNFQPALLADAGDQPEGEAERMAIVFGWDPAGALSRVQVVVTPLKLRAVSFGGLRPSLGDMI